MALEPDAAALPSPKSIVELAISPEMAVEADVEALTFSGAVPLAGVTLSTAVGAAPLTL